MRPKRVDRPVDQVAPGSRDHPPGDRPGNCMTGFSPPFFVPWRLRVIPLLALRDLRGKTRSGAVRRQDLFLRCTPRRARSTQRGLASLGRNQRGWRALARSGYSSIPVEYSGQEKGCYDEVDGIVPGQDRGGNPGVGPDSFSWDAALAGDIERSGDVHESHGHLAQRLLPLGQRPDGSDPGQCRTKGEGTRHRGALSDPRRGGQGEPGARDRPSPRDHAGLDLPAQRGGAVHRADGQGQQGHPEAGGGDGSPQMRLAVPLLR